MAIRSVRVRASAGQVRPDKDPHGPGSPLSRVTVAVTNTPPVERAAALKVLQWLRSGEDPCPWDPEAVFTAARGNARELHREAVARLAARGNGRDDVCKWLRATVKEYNRAWAHDTREELWRELWRE
jgi:hypothetical protein